MGVVYVPGALQEMLEPMQDYILNCVLFQLLSTILPRLSIGCYTESLLHSVSFLALGSAVINLIGHLSGPLFHL